MHKSQNFDLVALFGISAMRDKYYLEDNGNANKASPLSCPMEFKSGVKLEIQS